MRLAPSLLAANFANFEKDIKEVEKAGIDLLHIDVMDGHFVPNIAMGVDVVKAIRPITSCELDVHLMIEQADAFIHDFAKAGANMISVHVEACSHLHRTIQLIKQHGVKAGVVLNPATPVDVLTPILGDIDFVLIMTVNPGFGGQSFIHSMVDKISALKAMIDKRNLSIEIEVDGGINAETLPLCLKAGATLVVAGSAIFGQENRQKAIQDLLEKDLS
ncbi:ribulose-phosphate 3-epimerase [Terrilactibacillus sp. BCM23-1]|uniref:Ribulose-phosphate 3-epimerase n=1 Tax=Terrilactibacillus tamarindi TaxID=2599694 RepID=A0A6N8CVJ7_9BACI|nr:ribulose-phosphate 3-epimerase [Terrilactibacillus tamarindi]MTT32316.1 ribulose-phosphate 3-epimerase [Terrilactibacillus tamarindi]